MAVSKYIACERVGVMMDSLFLVVGQGPRNYFSGVLVLSAYRFVLLRSTLSKLTDVISYILLFILQDRQQRKTEIRRLQS